MDPAGDVRQAALETLREIEPTRLAEELETIVADASMLPGAVTMLTAEAVGGPAAESAARERAVGVQLSYEGLRLTRRLIREEEQYAADDPTESYLALVAAEVLVARGFTDLAETAVADDAIAIVQRFSHNQSVDYRREETAETSLPSLERDVIALAVSAGATTTLETVPPSLAAYGERLGAEFDEAPLPDATGIVDRIRRDVGTTVTGEDAVVMND